jgi:hypothetical protein
MKLKERTVSPMMTRLKVKKSAKFLFEKLRLPSSSFKLYSSFSIMVQPVYHIIPHYLYYLIPVCLPKTAPFLMFLFAL